MHNLQMSWGEMEGDKNRHGAIKAISLVVAEEAEKAS